MDPSQHSPFPSPAAAPIPEAPAIAGTGSNPAVTPRLATLGNQLNAGSEKTQLPALAELATLGVAGQEMICEFLRSHPREPEPSFIQGRAYEILLQAEDPSIQAFLQTHFPTGVVALNSDRGIDYLPLQQLLARQEFQAADRLTLEKLCELAGPAALKRKWVYFTEVESFPTADLQTINQLWRVHSEGKFGFSVQRQLWLGVGRNWEALWPKIGWKLGKKWTRYPDEFTWNLSAPQGHLPLSNQLRGVQVFNALLTHPAWSGEGRRV